MPSRETVNTAVSLFNNIIRGINLWYVQMDYRSGFTDYTYFDEDVLDVGTSYRLQDLGNYFQTRCFLRSKRRLCL